MAFKMKNPSIAKMVKAAGDSRVAMKMKAESAMKMRMEAAMKAAKPDFPDIDGDGNTSESMKRAAADKRSGVKMKSAMKLDKNKEGSYTTHGNPSKYTTDSGKSVSSANIDEGNLSTVKTGSDGRKFVVVQDATEKFKAGTKLYLPKDSAAKMKKSAMKLKTFERKSGDLTQDEAARDRDRGEGRNPKQDRRNFYNEKRTRRKVEKSRKADAKARAAMAELDAKAPKTKAEQDAMSAKDAKKVSKLGKKAAKAEQKARVKEAVAQRQLNKQGSDPTKPKRTKKEKFKPIAKISGIGKTNVGATIKHKIKDVKSGDAKARRARNKAAKQEFKADRKSYRQRTGLRGAVNVRRKAKGKDEI